jgi:predicted nucleic acid-binding protein
MKALVDTCVWSLMLRRRNPDQINPAERRIVSELKEAIQERRAAIIGPVRQEILSGIRDGAVFAFTAGLLEPFRDVEILPGDFVEAARLFNLCRNHGVQSGPVDILLCAVAARNHYAILTIDHGLERCVEVLRMEGIMA